MKSATRYRFTDLPKNYPALLCGLLMPRPVRDEVGLANMTEISDAVAGHKLTKDQED